MKRYIYYLIIIIFCISSLLACTKNNINNGVEGVRERKLEDIKDEEILNIIKSAYQLCNKINVSIDEEQFIEIDVKTTYNKSEKTSFAKAKSPYETPEKRQEALKEYFLDYSMFSKVVSENQVVDFQNLIKIDGEYYYLPYFEDKQYVGEYDEVISKEVKDDKLVVVVQYKYIDYGYKEIWFVLDDGKLKIDNISKIPSKSGKEINDEEILNTINSANKLYNEIRFSINYNEPIEKNIIFPDGVSKYINFYKVKEPYNDIQVRRLEISKYFMNGERMLCSSIGSGIRRYQNNILYSYNGSSYFHMGEEDEAYNYVYGEVVERIYSDYNDSIFSVVVKSEDDNKSIYGKYNFINNGPKLMIDSAEIQKVLYKNKSYTQLKEGIIQNTKDIFNNINGNYSVVFADINENDVLSINNAKAPAASTIKIYVMIEAYNQIKQGKLSLNNKITLKDTMKVGGSGTLQNESAGSEYTIEKLIELMMVESDNTAANILIDRLGMDNINKTIKALGCVDTELNREMMDADALNNGIDNYTSVNDLSLILNKLYNGECVDSSYDNKMLDIMKKHQLKSKIPNKLPEGTIVAHKSGEMGGIENDAAIVYTGKGAYILCILTDSGTSSDQVMAISDVSREIYDKFMEYKGD